MPAIEPAALATWTFVAEALVPSDVTALLVSGEEAVTAYKTFRDTAIFTTKRLIVRDAQGVTGKKVEVYSLPTPRSACGRRRTRARLTSTPS